MMERSAAFPGRGDLQQEQGELAPFRNLPDQTVDNSRSSSFRHKKDFFVPVSINGRPASYFLDTGAAISCMSASEARRLGLTIRKTRGNIGTATGRQTGFRTAVARRLSIGNVHLKNVSFAVFRDDQEPWSLVPPGRRGLFGIPVLLAFRTLSWTRSGTIEVGSAPGRRRERQPNLCFADDHLVMAVGFQQRQILATLDTGAVSTDLYAAFAREFSELTRKSGKKGSTEVRGVGQAANYESITLPELTFHIGGYDTVLRPVPILLRQIGPKYCCGNIGIDLLQQARAFRLDFGAMTLELQ